jgi:mannan endo-1,4-beta-mannosidase
MAWQLANEPVGANNVEAYRNWINETAKYIKGLDATHLVSIGSEGNTPSPKNGTNFEIDHQSAYIDYCTFHLWAQNWGWYDPAKPETYAITKTKAKEYIATHVATAKRLNKPFVLEEFGISRDGNSYNAKSAVTQRDNYYSYIFEMVYGIAKTNPNVAGVNFWAWGGEARPRSTEGGMWQKGDEFTGDPPHESQGWYSVFDSDTTTQKIIKDYATKFSNLQ